jgi:hypothetical protein
MCLSEPSIAVGSIDLPFWQAPETCFSHLATYPIAAACRLLRSSVAGRSRAIYLHLAARTLLAGEQHATATWPHPVASLCGPTPLFHFNLPSLTCRHVLSDAGWRVIMPHDTCPLTATSLAQEAVAARPGTRAARLPAACTTHQASSRAPGRQLATHLHQILRARLLPCCWSIQLLIS